MRELPETNAAPVFTERVGSMREVAENTAADGAVGDPVKAADGDEDVLTYSLSGGADKGAFEIDAGERTDQGGRRYEAGLRGGPRRPTRSKSRLRTRSP